MEGKCYDTHQVVTTSKFIVSSVVVFVIVYSVFINRPKYEKENLLLRRSVDNKEVDDMVHKNISSLMNADYIKNNSYHYSEYPHLPGSKRCEILANEMAKEWKDYGFDHTELFKYRVLLSFPEKPAEIHLGKNKLIVSDEPPFGDSEEKGDVVYPFNAYSISGNVTGKIVYINYGLDEDYDEIGKMEIDLKKKIFLIRYGTPSPRSKLISRAEKHGAIGVIFYSDPDDYTYRGEEYPKGWMLNENGVQRGSVYELTGDALSIGYPSKDYYYRDSQSTFKYQYNIPAQPVSAKTAAEIFKYMNGDSSQVPDRFKGKLNVTYSISSGEQSITLKVENKLEDKDTFVVCGSLYGGSEPDRYIVLGNHRDAWTYGAADPVSGSAAMTEIVRALGKYHKKTKYRPRRSIMTCSWGAEEAGLLGSTEWADENAHFISSKVVAYLNVDMAVEGNYTIQIKSLDHMVGSIFKVSKQLKSPDDEDITLFKDMCHKHAKLTDKSNDLETPNYDPPGAVSDNKHFSQRYGISVSDYRYIYNKKDFPKLSVHNGHYHTLYDSFDWMSKFVDPKFDHHLALGRLWMQHALILADAILIPFDLTKYAKQVQKYFSELEEKYKSLLTQNKISLKYANTQLQSLVKETENFHKYINNSTLSELNPGKLRSLNDRIMHFEKNFILESNVGKQKLKHIVYSTQERFYGIVYALTKDPGEDWDNVRREVTLFVWCVDMATRSLNLDELKMLD